MSEIIRKISANVLHLSIGDGAWQILNFIIFLVLARGLSIEDFGKFSFVFSLAAVCGTIVDLGINSVLIRDSASEQEKAKSYLRSAIILRSLIGIIVVIVVWVASFFIKEKISKYLLLLLTAQIVLFTINTTFFAIFRSQGKFQYETLMKIINRIATLIFVIVFVYLYRSLEYIGLGFLLGTMLAFICSLLFLKEEKGSNKDMKKELLRKSWPFGLVLILTTIYYKSGIFFLSFFVGPEYAGFYNLAFNILLIFCMIPWLINGGLYPLLAKNKNDKEIKIILGKYQRILRIAALICIFGSFLFGKMVITSLYGKEYSSVVEMVYILSLSTWALFQNSLAWTIMAVKHLQKKMFIITAITTMTNIIFNITIIPLIPLYGAGIAFLGSEMGSYLFYRKWLRKILHNENK